MRQFNYTTSITLLFLVVFALTACSTGKVNIFTNPPEAQVYAKPIGHGELKLIGKTPYSIDSTEFEKIYGKGGAVYLEIKKEGFKSDSFFITEISRVDLSINRNLELERDRLSQEWLNVHVTNMFEIRRLIESRRFTEAMNQIGEVKKQLPLVSAVHELEGGILLLKGDYRSSVDAYRLAVKLNPENTEAAKMVKYLERTYGFTREVNISEYEGPLPGLERKPSSKKTEDVEAKDN